jgi:hypothetical protein
MTDSDSSHLNLRGWPFSVVPPARPTEVWIGRDEARRRMRSIIRSAGRVPTSQILLLWADFGAGKTHALRHLQFLALENPELVPLYVVTPQGVRSFLDLYRAIIEAMHDAGFLQQVGQELFNATMKVEAQSDLDRALIRVPTYNEHTSKVALAWLRAEKVPATEMRDLGITRRLETVADVVNALDRLLELLRGDQRHVILLIDEMQELADLGKKLPEAIGGLHKVFDRSTEGLTLVFSFTTGSQQAVRGIIGEALHERASVALTLPSLDMAAARELVLGLLREHSIDSDRCPFPFTDEAVATIVEDVARRATILTPRQVLKAFNAVLREAEMDIEDGAIQRIDPAYAHDALVRAGLEGQDS